jgi:hypothetical protein
VTDPRDPALVPAPIADSVRLYLEGGRRPGSFLAAVLDNNLKLAALKADPANARVLVAIVFHLHTTLPESAWGSPSVVAAWTAHRGLAGLEEPT